MTTAEAKQRLRQHGAEEMTMDQLCKRVEALGYRVVRNEPCYSIHRTVLGSHNGPFKTGDSYPGVTFMIQEADTGKSAFHVHARRDAKFRELQQLRADELYLTTYNNHIVSL